jgi:integrase
MRTMKGRIGLRSLRELGPDQEIWDTAVPGFTARRQSDGGISFTVVYRSGGRQRRYTIGRLGVLTPDQARTEAARVRVEVAAGGDPAADKQAKRKAETIDQLLDMYISDLDAGHVLGRGGNAKKAGTIDFDKSAIQAHIRPLIGSRSVADFTRRDAEKFMRDVADGKTASTRRTRPRGVSRVRGGKGAATRVMGLFGAIMSYAVSHGMRPDNPCAKVRRYADGRRERRLTDDEYAKLGTGLKAADGTMWPPAVACFRFLMLTGWRVGEALSLRWRDADLVRRTAILPDTKSGRSMRPLSNAACDLLRTLNGVSDNQFVFPASRPGVVMSGFKRHARRIVAISGLSGITPHVLRHSYASLANDLGFSDATIGSLIGHRQRSITSRYVHGADAVLLAAADQVARRTSELTGETAATAEVVELRRTVNLLT